MNSENIKKILKVVGFVVLAMFLAGVFNLFFGTKSYNGGAENMGYDIADIDMMGGEMFSEKSMPASRDALRSDMPFMEIAQEVAPDGIVAEETITNDKKVIKNGNLVLKVEKTEKAVDSITQIIKASGGEIFSTNFYERVKGQKSGTVVVKVPVVKFEETVTALKKVASQVINESTSGQDVTEQYTDLEAQLKNKKAEEESFVAILDRAGKIDDVLAVTEQIARVRGEIERIEGRIKYLNSQTDMSTIMISISEDVEVSPVTDSWRPWQVVKQSFNELINNIQDFANSLIRFIVVGIPSLIPFLLFLWLLYWGGKKIYNKIKVQ